MLVRVEGSLGTYWINHHRILYFREIVDADYKYIVTFDNCGSSASMYTNVSPKDVNDAVRKFYAESGWDGK